MTGNIFSVRNGLLAILIAALLLNGMTGMQRAEGASDVYTVSGTKILKNGNEFILNGINVNGPNWCWGSDTNSDASLIVDKWKFNAIRINTDIVANSCTTNNNLDQIVDTYTAKGAVIIIEVHNHTGSYYTATSNPTLTQLKNWWTATANKYKSYSNVWFNIANEPGEWSLNANWRTQHQTVIQAIRAAGANNIILVDGGTWGQDCGYSTSGNVLTSDSELLSHGQTVKGYDSTGNIAFGIHTYGCYDYNNAKLSNFITAVHNKNLAVIFGEWGSTKLGNMYLAAQNTFNVSNAKKIGKLAWHWDGGDDFELTTSGNGWGGGINDLSGSRPSNLTWIGELIWNANRGITSLPISVNDGTTGTANHQFQYVGSGWVSSAHTGAYQNDNYWSDVTNDYVQFKFTGKRVKLYSSKAGWHGKVAVSIDDGAETIVDLYQAARQDNVVVYTSPSLSSGTHTLKVRITGTRNSSSTGNFAVIDRVDVFPY